MAARIEDEVQQVVEGIIADEPGLFLVKVILKGNPGNQKLIVLLDGDEGVTIDQCSYVSRALSEVLEERDLIDGKYQLEVSSAGVDFPLQFVRQYRKNVGRSLRVELLDGKTISGELRQVDNEKIMVEETVKKQVINHEIAFKEVAKSMVLVSFK